MLFYDWWTQTDHQWEDWFLLNACQKERFWKLELYFLLQCWVRGLLHYPHLLSTEATKSTKKNPHLYQVPCDSFNFNLKNLDEYTSQTKNCSFSPNRFSPWRRICPRSVEGLKHAALIISILMSLIRSLSGPVCAARMCRAQVRPATGQEQALLHHRFYSIIS